MTYCSGFTRYQPRHTNFKWIHHDSEEWNLAVLKMTGFYLKQYGLNTWVYIIILIKTSSQKSKNRVGYATFYNNDFVALWDCYKVFRLNKNNFLDNFSFIANWKLNFSSFFYNKQTFLTPKSIILIEGRVSENWQSAADYRKWSRLGSELTTFIDRILSKLLFQWVYIE